MKERPQSLMAEVRPYEVPLIAVLFAGPLVLGTVHVPAIIGVGIAVVLSFLLFIQDQHKKPTGPIFAQTLVAIMLVGCGLMVFQVIPLPERLLAAVSPKAAQVSSELKSSFGISGLHTISLDPSATVVELLKLLTGIMVFILAGISTRLARMRILNIIAFSGFTVFLIGIFQKISGVDKILGFYTADVFQGTLLVSTFVNKNHLAGFLGLSSCVSLGLGLDTRDKPLKILYLFMALLMAVGVFLTLSRGGIASFIVAQFFLLFLLLRRRVKALRGIAWWQLFVLLLLAVVSWLSYDELLARFDTISSFEKISTNSKLGMFRDASKMAMAYWPFGVGRGAFETAIDMFKNDAFKSWSHVENEYLQIACDMGMPYAFLLLGAFVALFVSIFLRPISQHSTGALAGVYMLALHNFVDFNLEISGVELAFFAVLGVVSVSGTQGMNDIEDKQAKFSLKYIFILCAGILAIIASVFAAGSLLQTDTKKVKAFLDSGDFRSKMPKVMEIMRAHPADYYIPLISGVRLSSGNAADRELSVKMLLHASWLNPKNADPHLFLARLMMKSGNETYAYSEYRQAIRLNLGLLEVILGELDKMRPSNKNLVRVVPEEPGPMAGFVRFLITRHRYEEAVQVGEETATLFPADFAVLESLLLAYSSKKELNKVLATAQLLVSSHPERIESFLYRASALSDMDRGDEALFDLLKAKTINPLDMRVSYVIANVYLKSRNFEKARQIIRGILTNHDIGKDGTAAAYSYLGYIGESEGRYAEAVSEYQRARMLSPRNFQAVRGIIRAYTAIGERSKAIEVLEDWLRLSPDDAAVKAELEGLKEARKLEMERARVKEYFGDRPTGD